MLGASRTQYGPGNPSLNFSELWSHVGVLQMPGKTDRSKVEIS